jgi:hypothetical protein
MRARTQKTALTQNKNALTQNTKHSSSDVPLLMPLLGASIADFEVNHGNSTWSSRSKDRTASTSNDEDTSTSESEDEDTSESDGNGNVINNDNQQECRNRRGRVLAFASRKSI